MRKIVITISCMTLIGFGASTNVFAAKKSNSSSSTDWMTNFDFGIGLGAWFGFPNTVAYWYDGNSSEYTKNTNFMVKGFMDYFLTEHFSLGIYSHLVPSVSYSKSDRTQFMSEIGGSLKARIFASSKINIKPGVGVGYRSFSGDTDESGGYNALGLNFSLEFQYKINANGIMAFVEPGFLMQPVGGNGTYGMTFAPIIYCLAGVAF